ncbi:MAG: hypothetical protein FJ033_13410 [Chloroflexi bacterium]|nr:hypothetical protein [Chloroflexota bacterium]
MLRRVGVESAWRFRPGPDRALDHARALLDGGGIVCEVGFPVDDLAAAADDDAAATELAEQAVAVWRQKSVS